MIYECDQCRKALPPGVSNCPSCNEVFEEVVLADAEAPRKAAKKGFTAVQPPAKPIHGGGYEWLDALAPQRPSRQRRFRTTGFIFGAVLVICVISLARNVVNNVGPLTSQPSIEASADAGNAPVQPNLQQSYDAVDVGISRTSVIGIVGRSPDLTYTGSGGEDVLQWKDGSVNVLRVMISGEDVIGVTYVPAFGGLDASEIKGRTL